MNRSNIKGGKGHYCTLSTDLRLFTLHPSTTFGNYSTRDREGFIERYGWHTERDVYPTDLGDTLYPKDLLTSRQRRVDGKEMCINTTILVLYLEKENKKPSTR